jgi:Ribosomal protein L16p/L10e
MFSLSSLSRSLLSTPGKAPSTSPQIITALGPCSIFSRGRAQLAPLQVKNIRRHKGRIPIPTGGSTKGTTLAYGEWGIRIKGNGARLSAKQLTTAEEVIKKKMKVIKGTKVYLRVFPDIPVCIKVNNREHCRLYANTFPFLGKRDTYGKRQRHLRILGYSVGLLEWNVVS